MAEFQDFKISNQLLNALEDLGIQHPTEIQEKTYSYLLSGKDTVGIAQTGTGKTLAYSLPILQDLKFSKQITPRVLILVPTRELVLQVVEMLNTYTKYMNTRVIGVYGGTNINTQKLSVLEGCDIIVATPGRLYDLVLAKALSLKDIKKMVIDEVDIMLDEGFRFQLTNIFELLPKKRQNVMFSATGITKGDLVEGVSVDGRLATTETLLVRGKSRTVRRIRSTHYLERKHQSLKDIIL